MATPLRPDGSIDVELKVAMSKYGYGADDPRITPKTGIGYGSRAWLLEHFNAGRREYKKPYFDDDPADGYPQKACGQCHIAIINYGRSMCTKCVEKFKMCKRCENQQLYLDWEYYHTELCGKCLKQQNGPCLRCNRPALEGTSKCHTHTKGNDVDIPRDPFWAPDFSVITECPVRPKMMAR